MSKILAITICFFLSSIGQAKARSQILSVPFLLHDNRILVEVRLDGKGPFTMIFDTGGANIITPSVQKALSLRTLSKGTETGAGEKEVESGTVRIRKMRLGAFSLHNQAFEVLDLDAIKRAFGFKNLDGIVGLELLQQKQVTVNFDRMRLEVRDFTTPLPNALPFELVGDKPVVEGSIAGIPAKIMIDTGDRSNLTLFRNFAEASGLAAKFAASQELITGMGVGGPIPGKVATVEKVALGPIVTERIVARLPTTKSGYFATSSLSGSLGIGWLKAFDLTFDYKNKRLSLVPRRDFVAQSQFTPVPALPGE